MHCELGKVLIYPEICTLIYSDFPSGASGILLERVLGIGVGTGVGNPAPASRSPDLCIWGSGADLLVNKTTLLRARSRY